MPCEVFYRFEDVLKRGGLEKAMQDFEFGLNRLFSKCDMTRVKF